MNDNAKKYLKFRETYKDFIYEGYTAKDNNDTLDITYHFSIPGLERFEPVWSFSRIDSRLSDFNSKLPAFNSHKADTSSQQATDNLIQTAINSQFKTVNPKCLERLIFSLGMVELISYWKTCCPPNVRIEAGALSADQISWWKKLYFHGLGEFFYLNGIVPNDDFMSINCPLTLTCISELAPSTANYHSKLPNVLIPIGGGKDSALTLELLRESAERYAYIINPRPATVNTVAVSGLGSDRLITAKRTLDKNMLRLNTKGYLNGHTPFSAIVAFSSVLSGYLNGMDYVALSNESSANESTVAGSDVNHQYSKSFEFETDFRKYEKKNIASGVEYFSLLRPLLELQIARNFARHKQYHSIFQSCNRSEKTNEWCGVCPKCLFVYVILSPFLDESELADIFHKDLYEDTLLIDTLDELAGFTPEKPFECVGRRDEVKTALELVISKYTNDNKQLPPLLAHYKMMSEEINDSSEILTYFDDNNAVPNRFISLVRGAALV